MHAISKLYVCLVQVYACTWLYARLYAMAISLKEMSTADFCCFLDEAGVHEDVTRSFTQNRINGLGFLSLIEDDLKELVPVIGDRICIRRLKDKFEKELEQRQQVCSYSFFLYSSITQ